jgi:hypothetical protein
MAVPWLKIVQWAPQIITLSRELLQRSRRGPKTGELVRAADSTDLPARVTALEENERRQAELVEQMALQQAQLSKAVVSLHKNQRLLFAAIVTLAAIALLLYFKR